MRLERLEITGFGRLRDVRYDFGERVTVVLGPNESGKSTLHRAVRAALYGLEAGGPGRPRERSEWARWAPWTGDRYGIALTYRLDSGPRYRVAQSFDRGRISAQVQEVGGGEVTSSFRFGRLVSPARVHLGVDEAVFCAAGWLAEDGLRLAAPDAPSGQSGRLREALERLVDTGPDGATAAAALERLREALRRVGSERRPTSPLGVATAEARRLEVEIDAARRRVSEFASAEAELRRLEEAAAAAAETAALAQRTWLLGRIGELDAEARAAEAAAAEVATLSAAMEREPAAATVTLEDEARLIALGGELHQADIAAAEAERRAAAANLSLEELRHRRSEITAGLDALGAIPAGVESSAPRREALRRRLAVSHALAEWQEGVDAAESRESALRREIAVTGLGAVDAAGLAELRPLILRLGRRRRRLRAGLSAAVIVALAGGTVAAWLALRGSAAGALAVALLVLAAASGLGALGWRAGSLAARAARELAARLPGADLGPEGLRRLGAAIPLVQRLHRERDGQVEALGTGMDEMERARRELEDAVLEVVCVAREAGLPGCSPPAAGNPRLRLAAATALLDSLDEAAARWSRRDELLEEDRRLRLRESQLLEIEAEARRRRDAASAVEAGIRRLTGAAGIDPSLPPLGAVAAFRQACARRREQQRLATLLAEARRRQGGLRGAGALDAQATAQRRSDLVAELLRYGGSPTEADAAPVPAPLALSALERAARSAQELAASAAVARDRLGARLEGMSSGLPALADLEDDRLAVSAARDRALHQQAALDRAIEIIEASGKEVHGRLAPRLAESVSRRLGSLTGARYREVNVDMEHFAVALSSPERDQLVPLDLVSHGTREQVALLLRLALCELLGGGGETMPLLLDEPAASSDPARRAGLLGFLRELSAVNQVVMTAHDPHIAAEFAAQGGAEVVTVIDLTGAVPAQRG